jgi:hypothetical protein
MRAETDPVSETSCLLFVFLEYCVLGDGEADLNGRMDEGLILRPLACWNCGFESRRAHTRVDVCRL